MHLPDRPRPPVSTVRVLRGGAIDLDELRRADSLPGIGAMHAVEGIEWQERMEVTSGSGHDDSVDFVDREEGAPGPKHGVGVRIMESYEIESHACTDPTKFGAEYGWHGRSPHTQ